MHRGRFAPSPTGPLHIGNLRTALIAWLAARSTGSEFLLRMEDLDRHNSSFQHEASQKRELEALGLDWDGVVLRQSDRFELYHSELNRLAELDLTYPCFCSRKDIAEAAVAPNGPPLSNLDVAQPLYPGTCSQLGTADRAERELSRPSALRLRADATEVIFEDQVLGRRFGVADDVVLRRNDGIPAYNLAVVIDDALSGIQQIIRGEDLAASTFAQLHIGHLLGYTPPTYAHVPLVLGESGERLAKRDGPVTLEELAAEGIDSTMVFARLAKSIGLPRSAVTASDAAVVFQFDDLPRSPWVFRN